MRTFESSVDTVARICEMRKRLYGTAFGRVRLDGKDAWSGTRISMSSSFIRQALHIGELEGLSGEDVMTLLAYNALVAYEGVADRLIEHKVNHGEHIFIFPPASELASEKSK